LLLDSPMLNALKSFLTLENSSCKLFLMPLLRLKNGLVMLNQLPLCRKPGSELRVFP
jgi:hypothetical protein